MKLLFWNLKQKPLVQEVKWLCDAYDIDILILAENTLKDTDLLLALNQNSGRTFIASSNFSRKISFYTRLHDFESIHDDQWGAIRKLIHPLGVEVLLIAVHIPSKMYADPYHQLAVAGKIADEIDRREQQRGHTRTVVIGDFNMNPFEAGLVSSEGFHGVMDKRIAQKQTRKVLRQQKKFFYNPMWSRLGDDSEGSAGTYYYNSSAPVNYYWHTFDQVLIRPALLPCFDQSNLRIIDKIDRINLIKNGKISNQTSDHLPIMIELMLSRIM